MGGSFNSNSILFGQVEILQVWNHAQDRNLALLFNAVLNHFKITDAGAFGFSMGGFILLETFDLVPAIRKIAIAGHPPLRSMADMPGAYHLNEDSALFLKGPLSEDEMARLYHAVIRIGQEPLRSEIMASIRNTDPQFREGCLNMAGQTGDQVARLNRFPGPVALIHAEEDLAVQINYLEKLSLLNLWEGKIQRIKGCGHFVIAEKPGELAALLTRFFING